ncbi:hypothetical protein M0P48_03305 [Candidatus Gracilibacteria bacterium]|nr:hypothetical protein [Candidatus Gracilibacteria bacterium]
MEMSILIARIFAVVLAVLGLGMIFNYKYFKKAVDDIIKNPGFLYFGGIMALVVGFLIVTFHNIWVKDWTVIVTILGWTSLLKGVLLLLAPKMLVVSTKFLMKMWWIAIIFALVLAGVLGYYGFIA